MGDVPPRPERDPEKVATLLFFLLWAERSGDPVYGSHKASDALRAACDLLDIPVESFKRKIEREGL